MFKVSLGRKITGLFLLIGLLPLAILSILFYVQMRASLKTTVSNNLITLASEVGTGVERTIFTAFANIKTLSENPILRSEKATKEEKLVEMRRIQDFYMIFEDITLVDLNGNVIISTTYNYRGAWETKSWYQQAREGLAVVSEPHILISPYKVAMVTTAPVMSLDNQIIAVMAGQINMKKVWEITDRVKVGKTGFVFLINKEGNLIAYPDKKRIFTKIDPLLDKILINPVGIAEYQIRELGKQVCGFVFLQGYLDYKGQGWRIGVSQNVKEAYAIIQTVQNTVSFVGFGLFLIILFVSIHLTGGIVRPVRTLVAGTDKVAKGDLIHQVEILSKDEIGQLAVAFNQMTKDLKKSRDEIENYSRTLEQKVEERTRQLKEAQVQVVQSAKMAAIGQLAAGVAHEINNPLGGIVGYAQLSLTKLQKLDFNLEDFKASGEYLKHIERESQRCKQIVENLLIFSRRSSEPFQPQDVKSVMENTLFLLRHSLEQQNIKVNTGYASNFPLVMGNANQLQQVFTNIIINAQHAMPKGGQLNISLKVVDKEAKKNLEVGFQDTGCGIPKENLERIFEPFFTTKQDWKSTGLGLSICYQIIRQHNGEILVSSEVDKGSIFTVVLPCVFKSL